MADRLPEHARLPTGLVPTANSSRSASTGSASFPPLGLRVLHRRDAIPVTLMVFDVLRVEGPTPCSSPRPSGARCPRSSSCTARAWRTPEAFDDGEPLLAATAELGREGVVAKRRTLPTGSSRGASS